jgi:peroxiredoxin-like protein
MESFKFSLSGTWNGGLMGYGTILTEGLQIQVSIPNEMQGPGLGTNPDELLLAASANCYMNTLVAILENRKIAVKSLKMQSEAEVTRDGGRLSYKRIIHRPAIILEGNQLDKYALVEQCAHRAEKACMISQALRGNVEITVEPVIE